MKPLFLIFLLFLPYSFSLTIQEDDLVFDDVGDEASSSLTKVDSGTLQHQDHDREQRHKDHRDRERKLSKESTRSSRVEKLWGMPHVIAIASHIFKMKIPKHAFGGNVEHYEAHGINNKGLPQWLYWDEPANTLLGVPSKKDVGQHRVNIKAFGKFGDIAEDNFTVSVIMERNGEKILRHKEKKSHCDDDQDQTLLTILLDVNYENLNPEVKVEAIENLSGFFDLHTSSLSIFPQSHKDNSPTDSSTILSGLGNIKHRKEKRSTAIQWQVGCDGRFWKHQQDLIKRLPEQSKDGTLAEVLQLPVLLWRIKTDTPAAIFERNRRDTGSGDSANDNDYDRYDDDNEDYDEYDEGDDEDGNKDVITESSVTAELPQVSSSTGARLNTETESEHPHRHHHGEETIDLKQIEEIDEHDIVPILDHGAGSGFNISSTSTTIITTTTTATAPSSPSPPSSILTAMTTEFLSTTTLEATRITMADTTTTTTTQSSIISPTTAITPATPSTITTTAAASVTSASTVLDTSSTVVLTTYPSNFNNADDSVEKVKQIEEELDTVLPTDFLENSTTLSFMTTAQPSTVDVVTTFEKQEPKTTVYLVNVTSEEPTEETTTVYLTKDPTTTPITTITFSTSVPSTSISTTIGTTSQHTLKTETSNATESTIPITTLPSFKPTITLRNTPPVLRKRLPKIQVFSGETFSFIIPNETFYDEVDGFTKNLHLTLEPQYGWLAFNNETLEIYGIPTYDYISKYDLKLTAKNSRGLSVSEECSIHIQQRGERVEFEFNLYLEILHPESFRNNIDWEFKVIRNLAQLLGDKDNSYITVTKIDIRDNHQAILSWTNNTIKRFSECPTEKIEQILEVLVDKDGNPSKSLRNIALPEISVLKVVSRPGDLCSNAIIKYAKSEFTTESSVANLNPILRNQIDRLNCTVGQLFVYRVPEDTFFDAKDGSTRDLSLSFRHADGTEISADEWLQFDSKNQEFYGVPMKGDVKSQSYILEAKDKGGLSARDSLKVHVYIPPSVPYSVEFSINLELSYELIAKSAKRKRQFIESISQLFGDKDTSAISLESITRGSTVVTWRNTTLPTDRCPNEEIEQLRKVLVKETELSDHFYGIMDGNDFRVKSFTLTPLAACLGEPTGVHKIDSYDRPNYDDKRSRGGSSDDPLITIVLPIIIILAMIVLAGIIACLFYKRRRSGKMSISEQDDERQSFRNKGIPVIFQDELDEKPDPGNKSPIILKEEKPPLPPPEYQKSDDGADMPMLPKENSEEPYQPPPPFATNRDNNRQNRPKPTPTYRKPPPYVPP